MYVQTSYKGQIATMLVTTFVYAESIILWYTLGIVYVSTASRHWPQKESMRGKWTPLDVLYAIDTDPEYSSFRRTPRKLLVISVFLTFVGLLTIWPVSVYNHAKRRFRTQPGQHSK